MNLNKAKLAGLFVGAVGMFLMAGSKAQAKDYTLALTTHTPTASATEYTNGAFPDRTGGVRVRQLILSNAGATAQDVTVYDTCTSSSTATKALVISLPAAIGTEYVPPSPIVQGLFNLTNPCIVKSSASSTVQATLLYE